jgi:hypothetical protein
MVKLSCTSSDKQCEQPVRSLAASVGAIAISTMPGAKSKGRARRKEVGLNIDFSSTLFGSSEWMIKSGEAAHATLRSVKPLQCL